MMVDAAGESRRIRKNLKLYSNVKKHHRKSNLFHGYIESAWSVTVEITNFHEKNVKGLGVEEEQEPKIDMIEKQYYNENKEKL